VASFTDPLETPTGGLFARHALRDWRDVPRRIQRRNLAAAAVSLPLVALAFARFGASGRFVFVGVFISVLCVLSAIDIAERRLPNRIVLPAFAVVLCGQVVLFPDRALEWAAAALGAAVVLALPLLVNRAGIGIGDVKLALLLGAALGSAVLSALVVASFAAAAYAIVLLARDGRAARGAAMPLGPFLAVGAIVALFM